MQQTVKERINFILKSENITENKLAQLADLSPQTVYNAVSNDRASLQTLQKIKMVFPKYSENWLINGIGEPVKKDESIPAKDVFASLKEEIKFLKEEITYWRETARNLSAHLGKDNGPESPAFILKKMEVSGLRA